MLHNSFAARHLVWAVLCFGGCAWGQAITFHSVTLSETDCANSRLLLWTAIVVLSLHQMLSIAFQTSCMFRPNFKYITALGCCKGLQAQHSVK